MPDIIDEAAFNESIRVGALGLSKSYLEICRQRVRDGWKIICRVVPEPTTVWTSNVSDSNGLLHVEPITRQCANELERLGIVECTDEYGKNNRAAGGAYILTQPKAQAELFTCPGCGWQDKEKIHQHPVSVLPLWEHVDNCFWVKVFEHVSFVERVPKLEAIKIASDVARLMKVRVSKLNV